jgi:hypothetical protein
VGYADNTTAANSDAAHGRLAFMPRGSSGQVIGGRPADLSRACTCGELRIAALAHRAEQRRCQQHDLEAFAQGDGGDPVVRSWRCCRCPARAAGTRALGGGRDLVHGAAFAGRDARPHAGLDLAHQLGIACASRLVRLEAVQYAEMNSLRAAADRRAQSDET